MSQRKILCTSLALLLAFSVHLPPAYATSAILVWPVDPVIEHGQKATALWLENRGKAAQLLQIRILAWEQINGQDKYSAQRDVVATPPMIRIEPGKRQMIRLTQTTPPQAGKEHAFRILIDEVPTHMAKTGETTDGGDEKPTVGVRFQFRYSIPLFLYGEGVAGKAANRARKDGTSLAQPQLVWRIVPDKREPFLEISNSGAVHARLTGVRMRHGSSTINLADGLYGYVLPGSSIRRPLPAGMKVAGSSAHLLEATINNSPQPTIISVRDAVAIVP